MPTFRLQIVSLEKMIFDADVKSVYLFGDEGEYELLPFHYSLMGALPAGEIKIEGHESVPIKSGVVLFKDNRCTIVTEEAKLGGRRGISWRDLTFSEEEGIKREG